MSGRAILINGYPAAGKTTLLAALRHAGIACPIFSKDDMKQSMMKHFGVTNQTHGKQMNNSVIDILLDVLNETGRAKSCVLLEANFKPVFDQERVQAIVDRHSIQSLQIMLTASPDELLRRDSARITSGIRDKGHSPLRPDSLREMLEQVQPFDLPGSKVIEFDTTNPAQAEYDRLIEQICQFATT